MWVNPVMFLPMLIYRAWFETFVRPMLKEVKENAEAAETAMEAMHTRSTPV